MTALNQQQKNPFLFRVATADDEQQQPSSFVNHMPTVDGDVARHHDAPRPRRISKGSPQQEAIWSALLSPQYSDISIVNEARAGTGKSSTSREGALRLLERNPKLRIRYTVFNSQNAREFEASLPRGSRIEAGTLHSFGLRALCRNYQSKVEKNKTYLILDETQLGRTLPRYLRKSASVLVSHAKNAGLRPGQPDLLPRLEYLALHHDVRLYGSRDTLLSLVEHVLERSLDWVEVVDFDDMIWMPSQVGAFCSPCDVLFVDECQDLNPAQHALIDCVTGGNAACRIVAVGDSRQSLYAFRGADEQSMGTLRQRVRQRSSTGADALELPLTISWRCPQSHIDMARQIVPDIEARPGAPAGVICCNVDPQEALDCYQPGDLVLCPTNAPLISAGLKLIARRRRAVIRGRRVGDQLLDLLRGISADGSRTCGEIAHAVERWRSRELSRLSNLDGVDDLIEGVNDRALGLHAVLSACDSPGDVPRVIAELFSEDASNRTEPGSVIFSTVHRAKGLEADQVWVMGLGGNGDGGRSLATGWQDRQAENLRYVALTRSKHMLAFVVMPA